MSDGKRTRVALYGGAFDPLHNGHLATIAGLLASGVVDKVLVIPSGDRPDKKVTLSAAERLAMTRMAIEESFPGDARVDVSDVHVSQRVGYGTIDLVDFFTSDPSVEPFVVIGRELLKDLDSWKDGARLRKIARFIVIARPGATDAIPNDLNVTLLSFAYEAGVFVSSTTLRDLLGKGLSCAGLMPASVIALCKTRGFYGAR